VIIEKTPDSLDIYDPQQNYIVCANHFQSKGLVNSVDNKTQIRESASAYRYQRVMELLNGVPKNTVEKTIAILRDTRGLKGADIGMGNEKAINQLIAHHSIVFEPKKLLVWVSTAPWQEGRFVCYNLSKVFSLKGMRNDQEIIDSTRTIASDTLVNTAAFAGFTQFRSYKQRILDGGSVDPDSIIASNPNYYHAYVLAGDMAAGKKEPGRARKYYQLALTKEIATLQERSAIEGKLKVLNGGE
jgi:isopenicillin-N N-acyltransferase like protein